MRDHPAPRVVVDGVAIDAEELRDFVGGHDLARCRRDIDRWLQSAADVLRRYTILSPWEKRALLVASYTLGDEGSHWRSWVRPQLSTIDAAFMRWVGTKYNGRVWDVPL
jgi:hypothetical protein